MPPGQDVMLLSETRQQNTEVRLTLSKVSDKVDQVMQKVREDIVVMFGKRNAKNKRRRKRLEIYLSALVFHKLSN